MDAAGSDAQDAIDLPDVAIPLLLLPRAACIAGRSACLGSGDAISVLAVTGDLTSLDGIEALANSDVSLAGLLLGKRDDRASAPAVTARAGRGGGFQRASGIRDAHLCAVVGDLTQPRRGWRRQGRGLMPRPPLTPEPARL